MERARERIQQLVGTGMLAEREAKRLLSALAMLEGNPDRAHRSLIGRAFGWLRPGLPPRERALVVNYLNGKVSEAELRSKWRASALRGGAVIAFVYFLFINVSVLCAEGLRTFLGEVGRLAEFAVWSLAVGMIIVASVYLLAARPMIIRFVKLRARLGSFPSTSSEGWV